MKTLPDLHIGKDIEFDIFQYHDEAEILRSYFDACKRHDKRYSLRYFSKRLGSQSSGFVQFLLNGKRHISDRVFQQLVHLMGLREEEEDYLNLLIRMKRVTEDTERYQSYQQRLQEMRDRKITSKKITDSQSTYVTSWYHLVVREMSMLRGASLNIQWFKRCLSRYIPLSGGQIAQFIRDLQQARLLRETDDGIEVPDPVIDFSDERIASRLKSYHKEAMENGVQGLENPAAEREYGSLIVATSSEKFERLKLRLQKERREILKLLDTPPEDADMVVSFSFQLFPVAETSEPKPDDES